MATKANHQILEAQTDAEIASLFPLLREMGPHVASEQQLLQKVRHMVDNEGCHYIYIKDTLDGESERPVSTLSYRIQHNLFDGKFLYIADMITSPAAKKRGYAGALVDYAIEKGREAKCDTVSSDSGYTRKDAHRFFLNKGFYMTDHHFTFDINNIAKE